MLGPITRGNGECICRESPYAHTEIVAKVGSRGTGSVFNICSNHLPNYQRYKKDYDIELLEAPVTTEAGESHYHNCPICKTEPVECFLPIGDSHCGTAKCPNCLTPSKPQPPYCNATHDGYLCTLQMGHGGSEHIAHVGERVVDQWPITPTPDTPDDSDEEEPEECPNCGQKITPDNPLREFDGNDHCSSCYPTCSSCDEDLEDDDDKWANCNSCSDYVCKKCRWWCACCEVYLCKGCAHNGDHGVSQEF